MFREMRLKSNMTKDEEAIEMLSIAKNGVLAVNGDDGYPYTVPLSFAYKNGKIYFHSTSENSHKISSIVKDSKVSFCVITEDNIIPEAFYTLYKSVIIFGKARILSEAQEIENGIMEIVKKYSGQFVDQGKAYMKAEQGNFLVVEIEIEHMTGKAGS